MKNRNKLSLATWFIVLASVSITAVSIALTTGSKSRANQNINLGNKYVNEMDYENAVIAYTTAIELEPNNKEALEGLMQVYKSTENYDALTDILATYTDVVFASDANDSEIETITSMVRASYTGFDSAKDYSKYVEEICKKSDNEKLKDLQKESYYALASELVDNGDFESANLIIDKIMSEYPNDSISETKANILEKCAELAWKKRDFEKSYHYLEQALAYAKENQRIKDELVRVIEDYSIQCKNAQDYDHANELIAWLRDLRGDQCLADISQEIADMEKADANLQTTIEVLNNMFDADDISSISDTMFSEDFISQCSHINRVLFCNSLREANGNGYGTAIYNVDGVPYVYYGNYVNGKREGHGLWYSTNNQYNHLDKYDLNWSNDLPNGDGIYDSYTKVTNHGYGGVVLGSYMQHMQRTFTAKNGIYNGISHVVWIGNEFGANYDMEYNNGYLKRIEWEDVPALIQDYCPFPMALGGYFVENYYEYGAWTVWSSGQACVDGLGSLEGTYEEKGITLSFE